MNDERLNIRIKDEDKRKLVAAADQRHMSLSAFVLYASLRLAEDDSHTRRRAKTGERRR